MKTWRISPTLSLMATVMILAGAFWPRALPAAPPSAQPAQAPRAAQAPASAPTQPASKVRLPRPMDVLKTSLKLIEFARANESPLAMLTAVRMLREINPREITLPMPLAPGQEKEAAAPSDASQDSRKKGKSESLNTSSLLEEGLKWAKAQDDSQVAALIESEMKNPSSGTSTLGPEVGPILKLNERVRANSTKRYAVSFKGGEVAAVLLKGDGDTDLDLFVYDEDGNLVASDEDAGDLCAVGWSPKQTASFIVEVKNLGEVLNQYTIIMPSEEALEQAARELKGKAKKEETK